MNSKLRMLVATDLGPAGDLALAAATTWARRHDGGGVVLHVARARDGGQDALASLLDARVRAIASERAARFERRVEIGSPGERIVEVAREVGADLVVLGGRDEGHARWRFGSVAEHVVTHAPMPVLVARAHATTGRVIATSDLSEHAQPAVDVAREIARACGGRATVVHCVEPPEHAERVEREDTIDPQAARRESHRASRDRLRAACPADVDVEVVDGSVIPALAAAAEAHDAEVVVVASRGRTGLSRVLLGSVAGALVRELDRSVLVVRRPA